ncbi:MAG TPA: flagellar basal body-associated FliL family protein [Bdellovibrionota bacterium]|jgi:flagellar basal body-associated protein FliL
MADDKAAAGKEEAADAAPAGPKMVMGLPLMTFLFFAVNLLAMAGGLGFIVYSSLIYKKPAITESQVQAEINKVEQKKAVQVGSDFITIPFAETIITLRGEQGGKPRYAVLEAVFVCGSADCEEQIRENKAKVEDAIQTVFGARTFTELSSLNTVFRVKHEVLGKVNSFLVDTAAVDLLFSSFLIK